jgi:hypothetical protein
MPPILAERRGRFGKDHTHQRRIACASAKEVDRHLRLLDLSSTLHRDQATTALKLFDNIRGMDIGADPRTIAGPDDRRGSASCANQSF